MDNVECHPSVHGLIRLQHGMTHHGVEFTVFHHLLQEFDDNFRAWADQDLTFATLLSVEDASKAVVEHRNAHHPGGRNKQPVMRA